jgi:AraC-like DNA-binding protein
MAWFQPYRTSADLVDVLECRYVACSAGHHDLLPDGAMDLVWTQGGGVVLCGPDTTAWSFDMEPGREMAGVRFRPGAAGAVFAVGADELTDRRVPLADLLGARSERVLKERLESAPGAGDRMGAIEDVVRRHLRSVDPIAELAALVAVDPAFGAGALAVVTGLSTRQLRRRFDRALGYGPAFYARVARLQRFAKAAVRWPGRGLAELAAGAGYTDQSHLAKDARDIARRTPSALAGTLARSSLAVELVDGRSVQDGRNDRSPRWAA